MADCLRILGTGSREWRDVESIRREFHAVMAEYDVQPRQVTFVHGNQGTRDKVRAEIIEKGFDLLAAGVARKLGMRVEPHPAHWGDPCRPECTHGPRRTGRFGTYCQQAGNHRNGDMVALGADVCIAAPLPGSTGTPDCMDKAKAAGIPVRNIGARSGDDQPGLFEVAS